MFASFSVARARLQSLANQPADPLSNLQHKPSKPVILALKAHNHRAFVFLLLPFFGAHSVRQLSGER